MYTCLFVHGQVCMKAMEVSYFYCWDFISKRNLGRKGYIWLTYLNLSSTLREVTAGAQGRILEVDTEAETIDE